MRKHFKQEEQIYLESHFDTYISSTEIKKILLNSPSKSVDYVTTWPFIKVVMTIVK